MPEGGVAELHFCRAKVQPLAAAAADQLSPQCRKIWFMSFIACSYVDHSFRMRGWSSADIKLHSFLFFSSSIHVLDASAALPRAGARGCAKEQ
jgi:hypothetical protein